MAPRRPSARWAIAVLAIALFVVMPATAAADHGEPLLDDELAGYFGLAREYWGGTLPSCVANGVTTIPAHAVLYDDPHPDVAARADQPGCRMWLDRGHWREMRPVERCMIVVHEWGHLLGFAHVAAPLDLMAEMPIRPPAACRAPAARTARARASSARKIRCSGRAKRAARRSAKRTRAHFRARRCGKLVQT